MEEKKLKRSAVIYAAGKGTRFEGLPEGMSKCVVRIPFNSKKPDSYLTPLISTINACLSDGIYDFHVVVGYAKESVIAECDRLFRIYGKGKFNITYVENTKWDYHGCVYSVNLGLRSAIKAGAEEIYLIEGDSLVTPEYFKRLKDVPQNAMLVRPKEVIDPKKSVVASAKFGEGFIVTGFWYDQEHKAESVPNEITEGEHYASGQVWKMMTSGMIKDIVDDYLDRVDEDGNPETSSGLITLGRVADTEGFFPVYIDPTEGVYNINTKEDYERVKAMMLSI